MVIFIIKCILEYNIPSTSSINIDRFMKDREI